MALEFHNYLKELRVRHTNNTRKLCLILKIKHPSWGKIERGINPPPKASILKFFARIARVSSYEEVELFALAKRWKPSPNTNRPHDLLVPPAEAIPILGEREYNRRMEAAYEANKPDYQHKHYKAVLPMGGTAKAEVQQEEEAQTVIHST
ncbi:MAG TPA: hypothetical protein QGH16_10140 [Verrucomicrobiota bacterium]|jgi:hypothetical protein|nr:hypothetical protein [Verrucomicrobiota bacterium]